MKKSVISISIFMVVMLVSVLGVNATSNNQNMGTQRFVFDVPMGETTETVSESEVVEPAAITDTPYQCPYGNPVCDGNCNLYDCPNYRANNNSTGVCPYGNINYSRDYRHENCLNMEQGNRNQGNHHGGNRR
jgi:hypothetical protein